MPIALTLCDTADCGGCRVVRSAREAFSIQKAAAEDEMRDARMRGIGSLRSNRTRG